MPCPPKLIIHSQPWETFFGGKVTRLLDPDTHRRL